MRLGRAVAAEAEGRSVGEVESVEWFGVRSDERSAVFQFGCGQFLPNPGGNWRRYRIEERVDVHQNPAIGWFTLKPRLTVIKAPKEVRVGNTDLG